MALRFFEIMVVGVQLTRHSSHTHLDWYPSQVPPSAASTQTFKHDFCHWHRMTNASKLSY